MSLAVTVSLAALAALSWAHWRLHQRRRLVDARIEGEPGRPLALPRRTGRRARSTRAGAVQLCYAVDPLRCTRCEACLKVCPTGALRRSPEGVVVDPVLCQACGRCAERCRRGALLRIRTTA